MERGFDPEEARNPRHVSINVGDWKIDVKEDPVDVFANNGAVRWVFGSNPDNYVFPAGGIKFDRNPPAPPPGMGCRSQPDPDLVFKNCKPLQRGEVFQCVKTGPHTVDACFKYDIKVVPAAGGTPIVRDPWAKLK